jgi:hypothetical protein
MESSAFEKRPTKNVAHLPVAANVRYAEAAVGNAANVVASAGAEGTTIHL